MKIDVDSYLKRLKISPIGKPSLAALRALHAAHVEQVPHENLEIQLGRPISVDPQESVARILQGRGGCCIHLNSAFATLLREFGYTVTWHRGGVQGDSKTPPPGADASHLVLTVECEGQTWYVDVGLGDALHEPLPLQAGKYRQGPFTYQLRPSAVEKNGWRFDHDAQGAFVGMDFNLDPASPEDFVAKDLELKTSPNSRFVRIAVVTRRDRTGVDELTGCILNRTDSKGRKEKEIAGREEWFRVLDDTFGLGLTEVSEAELADLWDKVYSRHQEWRRRQGG
ncbi:MAG: arylamine N-acetyltransferase family protein [Pseudonocardiaceae bacterium]